MFWLKDVLVLELVLARRLHQTRWNLALLPWQLLRPIPHLFSFEVSTPIIASLVASLASFLFFPRKILLRRQKRLYPSLFYYPNLDDVHLIV